MKHDRAQTSEDVWQAVQDGAGSLHIVDKKLTVAVLSLIPANGEGKKEQEKKETDGPSPLHHPRQPLPNSLPNLHLNTAQGK